MRSPAGSRPLAAFLVLLLVLVAGLSGPGSFVLAQDGSPVSEQPADEPVQEEPPAEVPSETPVPEAPTEVPVIPTEVPTLEPTVPVEVPATEEPIEPTLESSAPTEPSATATEAVDPAAIATGTLIIHVYDTPGVPSTEADLDIWLYNRPAGGSDGNADIRFQADGPTVTRTGIPEGRYTVYVFGAQPATGPVTIEPGATAEVDVLLDVSVPRYIVNFGVDWMDGSANNAAEVCFGPDGCPAYSNPYGEFSTDPSWHLINGYSMYLAAGEYTFYFRAPGRNVTSVTRTISGDTTVIGALWIRSLGDYGNLDIQLQTDSGQPIPGGYTLTVEGLGTTVYNGAPTSRQLSNLLPGWYSVTVSTFPSQTPGSGYQAAVSQNVYVAAGVVNYTRLILPTTYRVRVTFDVAAPGIDPTGGYVDIYDAAGKSVIGTGFMATANGMQAGLTLESGSYTYEIGVNDGDRPRATGSFTVDGSNLTVPVSMPAAGSTQKGPVTIHVVTDEGTPVHGIQVVDPAGILQLTDGDGLATFPSVLVGSTRFAIKNRTGEDYGVVVNVTAAGPNEGTIVVPHVAMSQTGTLVFEIFLSDGTPATVSEYGAVLFNLRGVGQSGVSNANSNAITFKYVPQGLTVYQIFAEYDFQGYQGDPLAYDGGQTLKDGSVTVVAGQTTTVRIDLPKTPTTALTPVPTATATTIPSATPTRTPSPTRTPTVPSGTPHTVPVTFAGCMPDVGVWFVKVVLSSAAFPNSAVFNFANGATANASLAGTPAAVSGGYEAPYYSDDNLSEVIKSVTIYLPSGAALTSANVSYAGGTCAAGATATATTTRAPSATASATPTSTPTNTPENTATATATATAGGNTPPGAGVVVTIPEGTLTFDNVTQAGETTIGQAGSAPALPSGFALESALFYDISTTAVFSGSVTVCLSYDAGGFSNPATVRLLHWDGSAWVDITSNGVGSNPICGTTNHLSPFAIVQTESSTTATLTATSAATQTATIAPSSTPTTTATASATATTTGPSVITTAGVHCRSGAGTSFSSLGVVAKNTTLPVRGANSNGWTPVVCFGQNGWIGASYVNAPTATATATLTRTATATVPAGSVVVTKSKVNCRNAASTSGTIIVVLNAGVSVPVRGASSNGWTPVICGGQNGWISSSYVGQPTATPTVPSGQTAVTTTRVNCRSGANGSATVITVLNSGVTVPVRGTASNGWTPVTCGGQNGWISSRYLRT